MAFKKEMDSGAIFSVTGSDQTVLFPIGFEYMINDIIYKVTKKFTSDNTEFRRLVTSNGDIEDVTVETILTDLRSINSKNIMGKILNNPNDQKPVTKTASKIKKVNKKNKSK